MLAAQPSAARLADWGPPKAVVARSALTNLLQVGAASIKLCSIVLCLLMLAYIEQRCWKAADLHQLACVDSTLVAGSCSHALMCWVPGPLQSTDDRSLHSINDRANHVNPLQSNGDLAPVFVDRSYAADRHVAAGYFQARRLQLVGMLRSAHLPVYPVHRLCIQAAACAGVGYLCRIVACRACQHLARTT